MHASRGWIATRLVGPSIERVQREVDKGGFFFFDVPGLSEALKLGLQVPVVEVRLHLLNAASAKNDSFAISSWNRSLTHSWTRSPRLTAGTKQQQR